MSFITLLKALFGLSAAVGLAAGVGWVCTLVPDYWLAVCLAAFSGMVVLVFLEARKFKATEGEKGGVAYIDYYDVFKCLSVAVVPVVVTFFLSMVFPNQINSLLIFSGLYAGLMLVHIAYKTAEVNSLLMLPMVLLVKIGLSVIWITVFYQMLNPAGKTRQSRRTWRTMAVMGLLVLTPLIKILVLGDEGKGIVQARLRGRSFAGAGTLRSML